MAKNYPEYRKHLLELMKRMHGAAPTTVTSFNGLHKAVFAADGALSAKHKELMALAISISGRCEGCIAFHTNDALKAGASKEEVVDTIGVALAMGGGPSMIYGCEALEALEQFSG